MLDSRFANMSMWMTNICPVVWLITTSPIDGVVPTTFGPNCHLWIFCTSLLWCYTYQQSRLTKVGWFSWIWWLQDGLARAIHMLEHAEGWRISYLVLFGTLSGLCFSGMPTNLFSKGHIWKCTFVKRFARQMVGRHTLCLSIPWWSHFVDVPGLSLYSHRPCGFGPISHLHPL